MNFQHQPFSYSPLREPHVLLNLNMNGSISVEKSMIDGLRCCSYQVSYLKMQTEKAEFNRTKLGGMTESLRVT